MNNTQSKVFMTGVWINYNIPWILTSKLLLLVSSAALLCISHARSLAANTLCSSSHKVGRLFARRGESMTSQLWTVWPCKNRLLVGVSSQGSKATPGSHYLLLVVLSANTSTLRSASPMALFPPLETHFAAGNIQCTFVLPVVTGFIFSSLIMQELRCQS